MSEALLWSVQHSGIGNRSIYYISLFESFFALIRQALENHCFSLSAFRRTAVMSFLLKGAIEISEYTTLHVYSCMYDCMHLIIYVCTYWSDSGSSLGVPFFIH